jgi:hypothetical protein
MRMVVNHVAFYEAYTMTQLVQGVEQLYKDLLTRQTIEGTVEFPDIRSAMLRSPIINHNHIFRPTIKLDVNLGDLGFFKSGPNDDAAFQRLDNILDQLDVGTYHYPCTTISASPNEQWCEDQNDDGSVRCASFSASAFV